VGKKSRGVTTFARPCIMAMHRKFFSSIPHPKHKNLLLKGGDHQENQNQNGGLSAHAGLGSRGSNRSIKHHNNRPTPGKRETQVNNNSNGTYTQRKYRLTSAG